MSELRIHLPGNWRGSDDACAWSFAADGRAESARGENRFADMPKANETIVIAPASRVLLLEAALPKGNRKQMRQALPFAVEDKVSADPETIHVAAGARHADGKTPLAVIDKQWLRRALDALAEAGVFPRRVIVETLAPPLDPGAWTVVWRGNEGFVRTGLTSGLSLAGNQSPPIELRLALREGPAPREIVVQPIAELPDLARWSSELGLPVNAGRRWDWSGAADSPINLLQGEFASGRADKVFSKLRPVLIFAAIIVALQFALTIFDWARLRAETNRLNAAIEQTFRQAFPDAKVVVDAPLQMQRNLAALRRASGQAESGDFFSLLANTAQNVKPQGSVRAIRYEPAKLTLDVRLPESQAAEQLLRKLQQNGMRASLDSVNARGETVEARYSIASEK